VDAVEITKRRLSLLKGHTRPRGRRPVIIAAKRPVWLVLVWLMELQPGRRFAMEPITQHGMRGIRIAGEFRLDKLVSISPQNILEIRRFTRFGSAVGLIEGLLGQSSRVLKLDDLGK
jgi:hypothetical protein